MEMLPDHVVVALKARYETSSGLLALSRALVEEDAATSDGERGEGRRGALAGPMDAPYDEFRGMAERARKGDYSSSSTTTTTTTTTTARGVPRRYSETPAAVVPSVDEDEDEEYRRRRRDETPSSPVAVAATKAASMVEEEKEEANTETETKTARKELVEEVRKVVVEEVIRKVAKGKTIFDEVKAEGVNQKDDERRELIDEPVEELCERIEQLSIDNEYGFD